MKHVTCKIIIASTFVRIVVVIGIVRTLYYPTHTSTPFQKKIRNTPQHTHYTPKPNHEKVTKTSITFDDIDKWVHYGQKNQKAQKNAHLNNKQQWQCKSIFHSLFLHTYTHTHTQTHIVHLNTYNKIKGPKNKYRWTIR